MDVLGGREAEWHIRCLYDEVPTDGSNSNGEDVVHVLSLRIHDGPRHPGFTISYKQLSTPSILRFAPGYHSRNFAASPLLSKLWRTPSIDFDPDVPAIEKEDESTALFETLHRGQRILKTKIATIKSTLKACLKKVGKIICPEPTGGFRGHEVKMPFGGRPHKIASDKLLEPAPNSHEEAASTTEEFDSTNTLTLHSAATTRSLSHVEALDPTATSTLSPFLPSQSEQNLHLLKLFSLVFILSSCLVWTFLRCRDPRRRAECLAWREERRNRKLYRRAARLHKWKMWFWNRQQEIITFWNDRVRYCLPTKDGVTWDEKMARDNEQEANLEDAMTNDIRALRHAHRIVSDITFAEEGRSGPVYESEGSGRRTSVSTLPGYESEGSQPPSYDDVSDIISNAAVDAFTYTTFETEFRSDSSVISTSPRISRDGTNSDFDEKIEPISLEASVPASSGA